MTTTEQFDTDTLPPTQYLVMEVLIARTRLGERIWTFPSRLRPAIGALAEAGLVGEMHGMVDHTVRAFLTDTGREVALWDGYKPPAERLGATVEAVREYALSLPESGKPGSIERLTEAGVSVKLRSILDDWAAERQ